MSSLENQLSQSLAGAGSLDSLYQLGITAKPDGTLELDSATLDNAFNSNPADAKALLNSAAVSFDALVDPYIETGGTISSVTRVVQRDLIHLQSQSVGLEAMASLSQEWAGHQFAGSVTSIYTALLNQDSAATLSSLFSSGSSAYPVKGISQFA